MNNKEEARLYTIAAFILGNLLIENLSSIEQNALGNWLMLVSQTLCTNGSYGFKNEWHGHMNQDHVDIKDILNKMEKSVNDINTFLKNQ